MRPAPARLLLPISALMVLALAVLAIAAARVPVTWDRTTVVTAVLLFVGVLLARRFPVHATAKIKTSVATAPLFAAALLLPAPAAGLIGMLAVMSADAMTPAPWFVVLFAGAEVTLRVVAGAAIVQTTGGGAPALAELDFGSWLFAVPLTAAVMYLINGLLVDLMVALQTRRWQPRVLLRRRRLTIAQEGALFLLGLLVAVTAAEHPWTIVLLAVPCLVVHQSLRDARALRQREVLAARDEAFALISHDLRNPVTSIKAFAQLLQRQSARMATPESALLTEGLEAIESSAIKMQRLVSDLADLARLEAGRPLDLECRPVDLVALVRREVCELQGLTPRHEIKLETLAPDLTGVWDDARLERVIANLLENAIKYSPDGGRIQVTLALRPGSTHDMAELVVRDDGVGIPATDLPRIFERYHRAANVVGRFKGTGLGLAGSKSIIEQHGGTIQIASQEGAGTIVTVRLSLA